MKYFILILLILGFRNIFAKELPYYIGADVGIGLMNYDANFNEFEGIDKCSFYENGSGTSMSGNLYFEYNLFDFLNAGVHIGYLIRTAELNKPDTAFARNIDNGKVEVVETGSRLDLNFNTINIGMDFNFLLVDDLYNGPLYLNISPSLYIQTSGDYKQTETINDPSGAAFQIDDEIFFERINAKGNFTTLQSNLFNISTSLYNNSRIADNFYLTQRIGVSQDLESLLSDAEISSLTLFASIGIKVSFEEPKVIPPPLEPLPPIQPLPIEPKPTPILSIESDFDYKDSYVETGNKLISTAPIVLAVFFDKNSSVIPKKYGSKVTNTNSVENHYNLFSRVFEILNENPNSSIIIWGSTSKDEENRKMLALQRTDNVKQKFVELGIDIERIESKSSISPRVETNPEYDEGREENRRVGIELVDAKSIEFVKLKEFERLYGKVDFNVSTRNVDDYVTFGYNQMPNSEKREDGKFRKEFEKEIDDNQNFLNIESVVSYEKIVEIEVEKVDIDKVEKREVELKTDEFEALLMFEFANSELSLESKSLLKQLTELLPEGKTISIVGNTDNIGLEEANIKLAEERAENAIEYIKNVTRKQFNFETSTNKDKKEELTPQGRFLNRSIIIRIK